MFQPVYPLRIRHHYLVDPDGRHPWSTRSRGKWYSGLHPEEAIEILHGDAALIWQQAGIRLEIEGIRAVDGTEYERQADHLRSTYPYLSDNDLITLLAQLMHRLIIGGSWTQGNAHLNVFWKRDFETNLVGIKFSGQFVYNGEGWAAWYPSCGLCVQGVPDTRGDERAVAAIVCAHELGHILGLLHPFANGQPEVRVEEYLMDASLSPFSNDVSPLAPANHDLNVMNYVWNRQYAPTVRGRDIEVERVLLTHAQASRARLTLCRRQNWANSMWAVSDIVYASGIDPTDYRLVRADGDIAGPVLPDWIPTAVRAAVIW